MLIKNTWHGTQELEQECWDGLGLHMALDSLRYGILTGSSAEQ